VIQGAITAVVRISVVLGFSSRVAREP
jgi:hypothetical protein